MVLAVHGHRGGIRSPEIADAGSAVNGGVAVQELAPKTRPRDAQTVVLPRHRCEVAHHDNFFFTVAAQKADHRLFPIAAIDPTETLALVVASEQRGLGAVQAIEIADQAPQARMPRIVEQVPIEAGVVIPFPPLAELPAHEQELLAGMRVVIGVQQAQDGELPPLVARHLSEQRALAVDHLVVGKMPGDEWRKFANLRLLYAYHYAHPGKKLLFMGGEFGQRREWNHDASLDWHLLDDPRHAGLRRLVGDLNRLYRAESALFRRDYESEGFRWIDCCDWEQSVISFLRSDGEEEVVVVCNFTPVPRQNYRLGVPRAGFWRELLNSDAAIYGGAGIGNFGGTDTAPVPMHGQYHSLSLTLPPLGVLFLKHAEPLSHG